MENKQLQANNDKLSYLTDGKTPSALMYDNNNMAKSIWEPAIPN